MAARCRQHHKNLIFRCPNCGQHMCGDCVETRDVGIDVLKVCRQCNVPVRPINPGDTSLWTISGRILKAPFVRLNTFLLLCGAAAFCGALSLFVELNTVLWHVNIAVYFIVAGTLSTFIFAAIKVSSRGEFDASLMDDVHDLFGDFLLPGLRVLFVAIVSLMPLFLYLFFALFFSKPFDAGSLSFKSLQSIDILMVGLLVLLAVLYMPMAVGLASIGGSISYAVNPVLVIGTILRAPGDYLKTVILCSAVVAVMSALDGVSLRLLSNLGDPPFVAELFHWMFQFYGGFVAASLMGAMLYLNWHRLRVIPSLRLRPMASLKKASSNGARRSVPPITVENKPLPKPGGAVVPKNNKNTVEPITLVEMSDRPPQNWFVSEEINLATPGGPAGGPKASQNESPKKAEKRGKVPSTVRVEELPPLELPADLSIDLPPSPSAPSPTPKSEEKKKEKKEEFVPVEIANGHQTSPSDSESTIPLDLPDDLAEDLPAPAPEPKSAAKKREIESTCEVYRENVKTDPHILLEPKLQWSVAGFFERNKKWNEAVEAYAKMGALGIDHPRAADGLLRAAFLSYKHLRSQATSVRFLRQVLSSYPSSNAAEKARKVLESIWAQSEKKKKTS